MIRNSSTIVTMMPSPNISFEEPVTTNCDGNRANVVICTQSMKQWLDDVESLLRSNQLVSAHWSGSSTLVITSMDRLAIEAFDRKWHKGGEA